jgi:type II secretory pathway pseudopilin PulG
MQLRLRTKLTLVMSGLVLLVVAAVCVVFAAQLLSQGLRQTDGGARAVANQVFSQAYQALRNAAGEGLRPESGDPKDIHDYVLHAYEIDSGLNAVLNCAKSLPGIY